MTWIKRILKTGFVLVLSTLVIACLIANLTSGVPVESLRMMHPERSVQASTYPVLRCLSANLAHGRADGPNQVFLSTRTIRGNLSDMAELIRSNQIDVVALQEADTDSFWCGSFNHVAQVAESVDMAWCSGSQVQGLGLDYGTALLARFNLINLESHTFAASPPTFSKGFVVGQLEGHEVDLVTVHLDFSRSWVRERQVKRLIDELQLRGRQRILMGDFNCDTEGSNSVIDRLCAELNLKAWQPEAEGMETFAKLDKRLDWILISEPMQFERYEVLHEDVSDHYPVLAEIHLGRNERTN